MCIFALCGIGGAVPLPIKTMVSETILTRLFRQMACSLARLALTRQPNTLFFVKILSSPSPKVTLQTRANFDVLVGDFASFAKNPLLTIIFVNPKANEKWLIKPAVHAAVADKSSLKTGPQAMFDTVPVV